ncbi:MAG: Ltp family lipoprotein [Pseudomonadota bacterium]|nr:Ltp family lipoprotein [Pseudomonadota bacterium]MEC8033404.1 Ltp family lipoprotein [Pseudomonadota bacterium]
MGEDVKKKSGLTLGKIILIILGIFVGLVVLGAIVGEPVEDQRPASQASSPAPGPSTEAPAAVADVEPSVSLTGPQENAARSARQYLSMSGFSRDGLIDQLSSDAGEGYALSDATVAVDSLDADWNEEAVRSAKDYLNMTGFSCKGLIEQLSSDAGSKFTKSQATYGAQKAGAC